VGLKFVVYIEEARCRSLGRVLASTIKFNISEKYLRTRMILQTPVCVNIARIGYHYGGSKLSLHSSRSKEPLANYNHLIGVDAIQGT